MQLRSTESREPEAAVEGAHEGRPPVRLGDRLFRSVTTAAGVAVLAVLVVVTAFLLARSWPALRRAGAGFFTDQHWEPDNSPRFGIVALVWGTLVSSALALTIAVPVAIGSALYITEYARPAAGRAIGYLVESLAAVPSVVYGLWGLWLLVPRMKPLEVWLAHHLGFIPLFHNPTGPFSYALFDISVVLALMVLPIVAAVCREVFRQVPTDLKEGALALGATRWETIRTVVIPFGRSGVVGAVILGLGRALGETIAVALILLSKYNVSLDVLKPGQNTIAANIAVKFGDSGAAGREALIASGVVLFAITLVVTVVARQLVNRRGRVLELAV